MSSANSSKLIYISGPMSGLPGLNFEALQTPFEALWSISRQAALDAMRRDIFVIRRIGEIMDVVAEEDFQ